MNCPCCGQPFPEEMAETKQPLEEPVESDYDAGRRLVAEIKASDSYRRQTDGRGYAAFDRPYWEPPYAKRPNVGNHKPPAPGSVMPTTTIQNAAGGSSNITAHFESISTPIMVTGIGSDSGTIMGAPSSLGQSDSSFGGGGSFGGAGATGEW